MKKFTENIDSNIDHNTFKNDVIALLENLSIEMDLNESIISNNYDIVVNDSDISKLNDIYEKKHIKDKIELLEKIKYAFYRQDILSIDNEISHLKNKLTDEK